MTRHVGCTPHRQMMVEEIKKKQKIYEGARRGQIGQGSMWVSCCLVVITPPPAPFPLSIPPLQSPLALPTCGRHASCLLGSLVMMWQMERW